MAQPNRQLDTINRVVTPENIAFEYRIAGPFRRLPAYLIDLSIRLGFIFALAMAAGFAELFAGLGSFFLVMLLLSWFILEFFYGGLFEAYWNGQTPGKRLLGVRVVSIHGSPINGLQAVLRNVLRFVDSFPLGAMAAVFPGGPEWILLMTYQVGLLSMMFTPRYQRIGDIVCGTLVVVDEKAVIYGVARIEEPEAIRLAAVLPIGFEVTRSLGKALSNYVERRRFFPPGRRADIARHLGEPLRKRFNLPVGTSHDLIVCALYYRTFIAEQAALADSLEGGGELLRSPFAQQQPQPAGEPRFPGLPPAGPPVYEVPEIVTSGGDPR